MAKQKKEKQLTPKQQIYQQIANYQVQQALGGQNQQTNQIQQLQAEYDNWNKVQSLQAEYDAWLKAQQPAQTKANATKVEPIKFATAEERRELAKKQIINADAPYDPEKSYEKLYGKTGLKEAAKSLGGVNQIPKLDDYIQQFNKGEEEKKAILKEIAKDESPKKSYMDIYTEQSLKRGEQDLEVRAARTMLKSQDIANNMLDITGANQQNDNSLAMPSYQPKEDNKKTVNFDKLADKLKKSYKERGAIPFTRQYNKWENPYSSLSEDEKQAVKDYIVENQNNPNLSKADKETLRALTVIYNTSGEKDVDTSNALKNSESDLYKNTMAFGGGFTSFNAPLTKLLAKGVSKLPIAGQAVDDNFNEKLDTLLSDAQSKNPRMYETGRTAGQMYDYALTSKLTGGLSEAAKLGTAGKVALNQLVQAAQDIGLDIVPEAQRMLQENGEIDWNELAKKFGVDLAANAAMESVPYLGAAHYDYLAKTVGNNADIFKKMDASGAVRNVPDAIREIDDLVNSATKQSTEAAANIDKLARQIPAVEEPVDSLDQFSDIMRRYNTETPSMRSIYTADDLNKSMDNQFSELMKQRPQEPANLIPTVEELRELEREASVMDEIPDYSNIWRNTDDVKLSDAEINNLLSGMEPAKAPELDAPKVDLPEDVQDQLTSDFLDMYRMMDDMQNAAEATGSDAVMKKFARLQDSVNDLESKVFKSDNLEEINKAKKAADAARQAFVREMKKINPNYTAELTGTRIGNAEFRRTGAALKEQEAQELAQSFIDADNALNVNANKYVRDAQPDNVNIYRGVNDVPGSEPLQTFGEGKPKDQWKISKVRTNTFENQGWGDQLPEKDFAYRVQHTSEQHEIKAERYKDSQNIAKDLLAKDYDTFDAADVKAADEEIQALFDRGETGTARRLAGRLAYEGTEGGRKIQAFKEYNKNTISGALRDVSNAQEKLVDTWKSRNVVKNEGNSRIAKALADMGHKPNNKISPVLTHDQIKKGVITEIEKEVGSVENYFNDNDIEFLTTLAEDKSIPVWQITSEIEHKLKTGDWYTLDESLPIPKPTNAKLQSALNSLVTEQIRTEKAPKTLQQITEEVRNTLAKEYADFEGQFTDNDIDYLASLINEGADSKELAQALNTKMATGSFGVSDETLQKVNEIYKNISRYKTDSKEFVEGQAEVYRLLADELVPNATALEKFETWRYLAMLGNPKTWIRNYVGNKTFSAVTGISNNIAAIAEAGIDKGLKALGGEGIQRTKAVLNPVADADLIKASEIDADASRYRQIVGSKYEKFNEGSLRQSKSVFNSKLAQLYEKVTDAGISDYKAVKNKYKTSLAGYLKANGYDTSIFDAETQLARLKDKAKTQLLSSAERQTMEQLTNDVKQLEKGRDFALKQAEYATFHEDNAIASVLSNWSRTSKEKGHGIGSMFIEGIVPFKKTPANVLRSGLEYSPLGAIDSIRRTGKLVYENTGKRAGNLADVYKNSRGKDVTRTMAADVIDSWSKTLTGTGLTALGFYLYDKGIIHSSDPDTQYQDQLEGHQNYSIEINGKSYTIDWAAPTVMPLMVGAELAKLWDSTGKGTEDFFNNIDDYFAAANRIADPLVETSMLSGIKDTLETAANSAKYNDNVNIPTLIAYNTATGYLTQGIPTIAGQIARTIDPTRRSTYTDKEGVAGVLDRQLKKQINKTPGLSMLNQPYIDTYGREQPNSPFNNPIGNLAYQMLSPSYVANINETDADRISREAYGVNQNANTLPKWQSSIKLDGQRVSPEDYTTASRVYGQTQYDVRNALANEEWFNSLDGPAKEEIVSKINTMSEHVGKSAIDPEYSSTSKPYNAYMSGGIPSLMDYFKGETDKTVAKGMLEGTDIKTNSNAGKAVVEAVSNGNMEQAEQIVKSEQKKLDAFESTGVKKTDNSQKVYDTYGTDGLKQYKAFVDAYGTKNGYNVYSRYQNAKKQIPSLSAATYRTTYNNIDKYGDSNGSVTQKEMLAYLNDGNYTQEEANQLWEAYGNAWKYTVKKNKNGQWAVNKK